jgi:hypothetical protein
MGGLIALVNVDEIQKSALMLRSLTSSGEPMIALTLIVEVDGHYGETLYKDQMKIRSTQNG